VASQDLQALPRRRRRLLQARTALGKQGRGLLAERGLVLAQGMTRLRQPLPASVADLDTELTPWSRAGRWEWDEQVVALEERGAHADRVGQRGFAQTAQCQQRARVAGSGPGIATALVAAGGTAREFAHGRAHTPTGARKSGCSYRNLLRSHGR
jgi:transposase